MNYLTDAFNRIVHKIKSTSFLKSVFTLSSGVVIAQAINYLGMPFLGRIYSPAAIGDYQLVVSNSAVISSAAALGLMTALMIPKEDEESQALCKLLTLSSLVISSLIIFTAWLLRDYYKIFHPEEISYGMALLTLWVYINTYTINNVFYAYVNRKRMYKVMFWNPVIGACINIGFGIGLGLIGMGYLGYTLAHILGFVVNSIHLMMHANPFVPAKNRDYSLRGTLWKYRRFPIYQMPANLVANLGNQMPVHTMEVLFGTSALGMYSMALRILNIPAMLLATPVNRVFYQEATQRYNRGEDIGHFAYKILETNIKIAIIPISFLMIFGRQVFRVFLGQQWIIAGDYAAVLGIYQLLLFCNRCLTGDFVIIGKNMWNLISAAVTLLINAMILVCGQFIVHFSAFSYLITMSLMMSLKIIIAEACFFAYVKFPLRKYMALVIKFIALPVVISMLIRFLLFGGFYG